MEFGKDILGDRSYDNDRDGIRMRRASVMMEVMIDLGFQDGKLIHGWRHTEGDFNSARLVTLKPIILYLYFI